MDITNIAIAIVSALGGGGLASILNHKQDSIKLVINTLQQENKEAQEDLKELRKTLENFQNKIRIQELQLIALESTHYGHPWPL
jgi:lipopolysaccharide biosynthesis glycosyltransferase